MSDGLAPLCRDCRKPSHRLVCADCLVLGNDRLNGKDAVSGKGRESSAAAQRSAVPDVRQAGPDTEAAATGQLRYQPVANRSVQDVPRKRLDSSGLNGQQSVVGSGVEGHAHLTRTGTEEMPYGVGPMGSTPTGGRASAEAGIKPGLPTTDSAVPKYRKPIPSAVRSRMCGKGHHTICNWGDCECECHKKPVVSQTGETSAPSLCICGHERQYHGRDGGSCCWGHGSTPQPCECDAFTHQDCSGGPGRHEDRKGQACPTNRHQPKSARLVLPLPPSINHYWRSVIVKNRIKVLLSREGRAYKKLCRDAALAQRVQFQTGDVRIAGTVYFANRRRDLDGAIKALLDALQDGIAYANDRQVRELHLKAAVDKASPRVEITISPLEAN